MRYQRPHHSQAIPLPAYSYAFQPIIDVVQNTVYSYEALLRGAHNEPAATVFAHVPAVALHQFDQDSRVQAIQVAAHLGLDCHLNVNIFPQSLLTSDRAIRSTLDALAACHLPIERLILEVIEGEVITNAAQFAQVLDAYRGLGLTVAIDDFGAGYAGLNLLADFQPDLIKLDMHLVRGIDSRGPRQAIVRAITQVCDDLAIEIIAEGVETLAEYAWLREEGIQLFQGYLLAKPAFESLVSGIVPTISTLIVAPKAA